MTSSKPLSFSSLAIWLTEGNSFRQSGHQVAQKNSIATLPRRSERWTSLPFRSGSGIRADAHDLGAQGLELRHGRVEAQQFLRSGAREGGDERVEDDRALGGQIREPKRFTIGAVEREVGRLLADLERTDGGREQKAREDAGQQSRHDAAL